MTNTESKTMEQKHAQTIKNTIIAAGSLVGSITAIIIFWMMFTNYIDGIKLEINTKIDNVKTEITKDLEDGDKSIMSIIGKDLTAETVSLRFALEQTSTEGYDVILQLMKYKRSMLIKKSSRTENRIDRELIDDELADVEDIIDRLQELKIKADKIWEE